MPTAEAIAKLMPGGEALASIHQGINAYNDGRRETENKAWRNSMLYLGPFALACLAAIYYLQRLASSEVFAEKGFWALAGAMAFVGYSLWKKAWEPVRQFQQNTKSRLIPVICGFVENLRYSHGRAPSFMASLPASALVQHSRIAHDDLITGRLETMDFETWRSGILDQGGQEFREETFEGAIFHTEAISGFPGVLIASKRASWGDWFNIGSRSTGTLTEVSCANKRIAETYEFHSDRPEAAAELVNGPMTAIILWLGENWPDGIARIALNDRNIFILVPSKTNHFELPEIHVRLDYEWHIAPMSGQLWKLVSTAN